MAKTCLRCNSPLQDGDVVCGYCGTPVSAESQAAKKQNVDFAKLLKDPKVKKFAPIGAVALVAIVLVLIIAISAGSGYKGTVNKYMKGIIKNNPEKIVKVSSATNLPEDEDDIADYQEMLEEGIKELYDEFEDEFGDNVKITYKIIGSYDISEDEQEYYEERLDDADVDYGKEVKGKKVVLLITIKGKDKEMTSDTTMTLLKEDGKWKVYNGIM